MRQFILLFCFILCITTSYAQNPHFGGAMNTNKKHVCQSHEDRNASMELLKNSEYYKDQSLLKSSVSEPFLFFPLLFTPTTDNRDDHGFYGISANMDLNIFWPDQVSDYTCGDRTYDTMEGYNHTGTDFFSWPFPWNKQYDSEVRVTAAAAGTIVEKRDGFFDENCDFDPIAQVNYIRLRHANGYTTSYLHLKKNTVTSKPVGSTVLEGEVIGEVGSSGFSTGPHLHFEVWDNNFNIVDPYYEPEFDDCNATVDSSLWRNQEDYMNPSVMKLLTSYQEPLLNECIETIEDEQYYRSNFFDYGETVYFSLYLRDQQPDDDVDVKLLRPDRTIYYENTISCTTAPGACFYYAGSWWFYDFILDQGLPCGEWYFQVTHGGDTQEHAFILAGEPVVEEIAGVDNSSPQSEEVYSVVNPDPNSSFFWLAFGGEIISGQNTESATVEWAEESSGSICLIETLSNGCSSTPFCMEVNLMPSSTATLEDEGFNVLPNPFKDQIKVEAPTNIRNLILYNIYGQIIIKKDNMDSANHELDLGQMDSGTYFLQINTASKQVLKKVVKL